MFTEKQNNDLKAKLSPDAVSQREQSGRKLSYIEGWWAISEANRIFGFDGWTRETVDIKAVNERPRKIGKGQYEKDGWGVTYVARVRVTAQGITREGTGAGHGIDADLGQAHESAIKEAETDAMKRALMTFGNPFGLALYDKTQENVGKTEEKESIPREFKMFQRDFLFQLGGCKTLNDVNELVNSWWDDFQEKPAYITDLLNDAASMKKKQIENKVAFVPALFGFIDVQEAVDFTKQAYEVLENDPDPYTWFLDNDHKLKGLDKTLSAKKYIVDGKTVQQRIDAAYYAKFPQAAE